MKIMFIAPIDISANSSAGAETINCYIGDLSALGCQIDVLSNSEGRHKNTNIHYYLLKRDSIVKNLIKKIIKLIGWIVYPQNRYLYKTTIWQRHEIFTKVKKKYISETSPDVIMLETTSAILLYKTIKKIIPNAVIVASLHDFAYQGSLRKAASEKYKIKAMIRNRYLKYAEKWEIAALKNVDLICPHNAGNEPMLREYEQLKEKKMFPIVPFYADDYFHKSLHNYDILFYGLMNRPENYTAALWFVEKVVPNLPKGYRFVVMGGKPVQDLINCNCDNVVITGFVSEAEVKKYYENSFCMVVPLLLGSGIKTKVLSALKCGLPVLSNDIGIEGIGAVAMKDYIHCETAKDYIAGLEYLSNEENYRLISRNSVNMMSNNYNRDESSKQLLRILETEVNRWG